MTRTIGFVGVDKYDLIIYSAAALCQMGMHVLAVDYTNQQGLMLTVPAERGDGRIQYCGIDYWGAPDCVSLEQVIVSGDYDFVLIDFGFYYRHHTFLMCNDICFVTDLQKHNLEYLASIQINKETERTLVVRQVIAYKASKEYLKSICCCLGITNEEVFLLYLNEKDLKNQYNCQYNGKIGFKNGSASLKSLLEYWIGEWVQITGYPTKRAIKSAERGVYFEGCRV